jgi:hypothetical protein
MLSALPELVDAFDVTLAMATDGPAVARARAIGAEVVVLPDFAIRRRHLRPLGILPWLARVATALVRLGRLHRRQRFDVIYSNTLTASIGPLLRRAWRVPHLLHVHECPEARAGIMRAIFLSIRAGTDRVVCNSEATRRYVVANEPALAGRTLVVHNGIDLPGPSGPPAASDRLRITCVGRIHPKKGQWVLVEAARALVRDGVELELHFYGDHLPEHQHIRDGLLRQVDEAGLAKCVTWHGFIDDTAAMYRDRDIAVVPSVMPEEFSLVCVEAQSMRLPVIATGPGGASEVVVDGETGLIVPPDDAVALTAALSSLAADPDRRTTMGRLGRERMEARFSRAPFGQRIRDLCIETARPDP